MSKTSKSIIQKRMLKIKGVDNLKVARERFNENLDY